MSGLAPGMYIAALLGLVYGALAHLLWGRHWLHLPLFLIGGTLGCVITWAAGVQIFKQLPAPGGLAVPEATVVAWLLLSGIAAIRRA
ncbi:MAG TPA: hypothetical protein VGD58_19860 [Herpetosiphonaceae bacterium]